MSEWKKVKLGEITDSCLGKMLDAAKNRGEYKPYLANLNVRWGSFDTDNLSLMKFEEDEDERYGIKYGDLIICEGGEPGRCAIWKEQVPDMKIQKALHRVRPKTGLVDNFYLFYWFLLAGKRNWIDQYCTGATIKHLPGQKLKEVVVDLPPLATQYRIATILSRYDSLIENYQKQIKLLEEAAQRLYKEWFVDLHFPGHENTKIVDGVPEGWEFSKLGDLAEFKRGKTITKKDVVDGSIPVVAGGLEPAYYCNKSNTSERVITVSGSGANAGFTRMYFEKVWASDCSYVDKATTSYLHFIYCFLKDNKTTIDNMQKGAAQPHVYAKDINALVLCIPTETILNSFENKVSAYYDNIASLQSQIHLLTEARDRLLPKLMSGEIAV